MFCKHFKTVAVPPCSLQEATGIELPGEQSNHAARDRAFRRIAKSIPFIAGRRTSMIAR
jgi:hypothetical protein